MSDIRMDAYYYGFDKTDVDCVDELLSCIACAGKAFHHTSDWGDAATTYGEQTVGETPVDWIQNSAIRVANEITRLNEVVKQNEIDAKRLAFISMNCELIKSNGTKGKEAKNLRYLREVIDQAMSEKGDK